MDKYEYKVSAQEIKDLIAQGEYGQAAEIADTIDWRRVKSVMMLCTISDLYKINRRYEDARNMLLLAYERRPGGRTICYSLCELSIKTEEYVQALNYYKEFVQVAPKDPGRYILQYKLYEAQDVSLEERIGVLEELKKRDYREKWAYELAYLYHRVGLETKCIEECDEMILWFGEGRYVVKAMELKMLHQPLSPEQQEKYDRRFGEADVYQGYEEGQGGQDAEGNYTEENYAEGTDYAAYGGEFVAEGQYGDAGYGTDGAGQYQDAGQYGYGQPMYQEDGQTYGANDSGVYGDGVYGQDPYGDGGVVYQDNGQMYEAGTDAYGTVTYGQEQYGDENAFYQNGTVGYEPGEQGIGNVSYQEDSSAGMGQYEEDSVLYQDGGQAYEAGADAYGYEEAVHCGEEPATVLTESVPDTSRQTEQPSEEMEIKVKTVDVSQYNTINLQAELAAGLREVLKDEHAFAVSTPVPAKAPAAAMEPVNEMEPDGEIDNSAIGKGQEARVQIPEETPVLEGGTGPAEEKMTGAGRGNTFDQDMEEMESSEVFFGETEEIGELPQVAIVEKTSTGGSIQVEASAADSVPEENTALGTDSTTVKPSQAGKEEEVLKAQPPRELAGVLSQESDGQISLVVPEREMIEKQITGQMNIEDVLAEWEQMKKESARKQKEEVRKRVLEQTGDMFTEFEASVRDGLLERLESGLPVDLEALARESGEALSGGAGDTENFLEGNLDGEDSLEDYSDAAPEEQDFLADSEETSWDEGTGEEFLSDSGEAPWDEEAEEESLSDPGEAPWEEEAVGESLSDSGEAPWEEEVEEESLSDSEEVSQEEESGEESPSDSEEVSQGEEAGEESSGKDGTGGEGAVAPGGEALAQGRRRGNGMRPELRNRGRVSGKITRTPDGALRMGIRTPPKTPVERDQARIRSLTREEKELYGPFIQSRTAREQLVKAIDNISMAAFTGNIIITGEEGMDTLTLAKNMIREVQVTDSNFSGKVAKISGKALNKKDVGATLKRLKSGALIIEKAPDMEEGTTAALHKALQQESMGIIIVLEGTRKAINKLLEKDPELAGCFTARVDIEALSNDMLVAFGRQYAREKEYFIDDLGVLALHTRVDELQTSDHVVTVMEVKEIVDEAIRHANRKTMGHFFDILLAKRYDEEDMIILSEKDFV